MIMLKTPKTTMTATTLGVSAGPVNATRPRHEDVDFQAKAGDQPSLPADLVETQRTSSTEPKKSVQDRQLSVKNSVASDIQPIKNRPQDKPREPIAKEALERINAVDHCEVLLRRSEVANIPEIFIDSNLDGGLVPKAGRAVVRGLNTNRAAIAAGQLPRNPSSFGRVFIYIPWEKKLEALSELSALQVHIPSMMLLGGVVGISDLAEKPNPRRKYVHAAAARLDLVFRFGLLGCNKNVELADKMLNLMPEKTRPSAYSFAMQDSVRFGSTAMIEYCLKFGGRPISPDDGKSDYRADSPIEIAFDKGTKFIQDLMLKTLNGAKDVEELKSLFFDEERWDPAPQEIVEYVSRFQTKL